MKKKLTHYLILVVIVIVINFLLPRLLPGSPIGTLVGEAAGDMTAAEKMGVMEAYHLNDPLPLQFAYYLRDLFTLNWGTSFSKRLPITQLIAASAGWTVLLASVSLLLTTLVGTFLGGLSALRHKKGGRDLPLVLGATFAGSLPPFWVALLLLAVFGSVLGWFPTYGAYSMWGNESGLGYVLDVARHLALPCLALVITTVMRYFTTARYGVLRTIGADYVRMARLRGITGRRLMLGYVMRNAFIPVFTTLMVDVGYLLSGSVLIEAVFSWPGLGTLMANAVSARDYPLIQYSFLLSSLLTIATLFLTDLLYRKVDPGMEADDAA